MTIKAFHSLSEEVLNEVISLESICIEYDNLAGSIFLDPSLNFNQDIKSFFLFYKEGKLISMITLFIPTEQEAEISAYTLPKFRGNGYFKILLINVLEELRTFNIPDVLFVCESPSIVGKKVLATLNAEYDHTEYFMRFDQARYVTKGRYRISKLNAELKDLEKTIETSLRIFEGSYEDAKGLIKRCLESPNREQYLAVLNNQMIGIGSVNLEGEDVSIFGLGLIPEYRGKGYGKELLSLIIDNLLQRGRADITIEVNSDNTNALRLYQISGFHIQVAYEYYRKKLSTLYDLFSI